MPLWRNMILACDNEIIHRIGNRQWRLGRILEKNGVTLKALSLDSGLAYNTLRSYFPADEQLIPCIMPISALVKLFGAIPDEWLSILTEPEGRCFSRTDDDEGAATREVEQAKASLDRALAKLKAGARA